MRVQIYYQLGNGQILQVPISNTITQHIHIDIQIQSSKDMPEQFQPTTPNITILSLSSVQLLLYIPLLTLSLYRLILATRTGIRFLQHLHICITTYILLQLFIQVYQLVMILSGYEVEELVNVVLAVDVFCMLADLFVLMLVVGYWRDVEGSFVVGVKRDGEGDGWRFVGPVLWLICYTGYFFYLVIAGYLTNSQQDLSPTNQILLYIVSQALTELLLLLSSIWQSYHWCKLEQTIQSFQRIIPYTMNKKRFKGIFWAATVFNSLRILFVSYLIVVAYLERYFQLIVGLNCFMLSAGLPIVFYLFGFKIEGERESSRDLLNKEAESEKSKKSSSAHETELSHHSHKSAKSEK